METRNSPHPSESGPRRTTLCPVGKVRGWPTPLPACLFRQGFSPSCLPAQLPLSPLFPLRLTTWRRVVPQRPACEGAFAPDGRRFAFVHQDFATCPTARGIRGAWGTACPGSTGAGGLRRCPPGELRGPRPGGCPGDDEPCPGQLPGSGPRRGRAGVPRGTGWRSRGVGGGTGAGPAARHLAGNGHRWPMDIPAPERPPGGLDPRSGRPLARRAGAGGWAAPTTSATAPCRPRIWARESR